MTINESFASRYSFITDILRSVFLFIDGAIYNLIQPVYGVVIRLSNIKDVLDQEAAARMVADKIYVFLALFMLFKLAFSIITMIANPDLMNDKQKGLSKVFSSAVITIVLVVTVPTLFNAAYSLQDIVIDKGILRNVFGTTTGQYAKGTEGAKLASDTFKIFFKKSNLMDANRKISQADFNSSAVLNTSKVAEILNEHNSEGKYYFTYIMGFSTVVGVLLLFSFITMAIEIGIRSIKLFLLQIISPIAIISYLDPASASKGIFAKWVGLTMKTYVSLFIRLGTMYFLVSLLANFNIDNDINGFGWLESLFLILAVLSFMKSGPKMIEELFGYKPSEDGKAIKGIVGGALGFGVGAAYSGIQNARAGASGQHGWRKFTGALGGATKGVASGGLSGMGAGSKKGGIGGGMSGAYQQNKKNFQGTEGYKRLQQAKGEARAEMAAKWAENRTPDYENDEALFLRKGDADAITKYNGITGPNAAELKKDFRKNEAEKALTNKQHGYNSMYSKYKNQLADAKMDKKLIADTARQSSVRAQQAAAKRDISMAARNTLSEGIKERENYKNDLLRQQMNTIVGSAEYNNLNTVINATNLEVAGLRTQYTTADSQATADYASWEALVQQASNDSGMLEAATGIAEKAKANFDTLSKEPKYSADVAKDQRIDRGDLF